MILELFVPAVIGERRLRSERIIGISIREDGIAVSVIRAGRKISFLERLLFRDLPAQATNETIVPLLSELAKQFGRYDRLRIAIPSSVVVFKELVIPFLDYEKIRMVIEYEVEPLLPFSIDEAVIDFLITRQSKQEGMSQVLVAAARIIDVEKALVPYLAAGIKPTNITVDLLAIYGLYRQIPEYAALPHANAIVDVGLKSTRVALLSQGELRLMRNIPKGIESIVVQACIETTMSEEEGWKIFKDLGLSTNSDFAIACKKQLALFLNDIQFTLNSFSLRLNFYEGISKILFLGMYTNTRGLMDFASETLQTPCEIFNAEKILTNPMIKSRLTEAHIRWNRQTTAFATSLAYLPHLNFDLRKKGFSADDIFIDQRFLITASIIIVLIFGYVGIRGYFEITDLQNLASRIERTEMKKLQPIFAQQAKPVRATTLARMVKLAEEALDRKQEVWGGFIDNPVKILEMLAEVTKIIDKNRYDVRIEQLTFLKEEEKQYRAIIQGLFKSKTGSDHFTHFAEFEKRFSESRLLELAENINESLAEDGGVRFSAILKPREL